MFIIWFFFHTWVGFSWTKTTTSSGWWFGTFCIFPEILGISSSQLTFMIFFRGVGIQPPSRAIGDPPLGLRKPWAPQPGAAARGLPRRGIWGPGAALGRRAQAEAEGHGRHLRLAAGDAQGTLRGWPENVGKTLGGRWENSDGKRVDLLMGKLWWEKTGWWFGTFFIFPYIGNNHPNWRSYFSEGWVYNHQPVILFDSFWFFGISELFDFVSLSLFLLIPVGFEGRPSFSSSTWISPRLFLGSSHQYWYIFCAVIVGIRHN